MVVEQQSKSGWAKEEFGGSKDMKLHWLPGIDVNNATGSADPIDPDSGT
jgi:hypothetical protein